jgi:recombinational DNA repair ATPase RecF
VRLKANCFRNLAELDLKFSPSFNFIYGPNGSGKSSLLEAIYFLSLGRSFRSSLASRAIQYDAKGFNLFSVICISFRFKYPQKRKNLPIVLYYTIGKKSFFFNKLIYYGVYVVYNLV